MAIHSSILVQRIPWTEDPVGYSPVCGVIELDMTEQLTQSAYEWGSCGSLASLVFLKLYITKLYLLYVILVRITCEHQLWYFGNGILAHTPLWDPFEDFNLDCLKEIKIDTMELKHQSSALNFLNYVLIKVTV